MKRYIAEFAGTFFLALALSITGGTNALAVGLTLMAVCYATCHIAHCEFNPALSIGALITGTGMGAVIGCIIAQTLGSTLAMCVFRWITGRPFYPTYLVELGLPINFTMEMLMAILFAWVVFTICCVAKFRHGLIGGFAMGLTYTAVLFIGPVVNPVIMIGSIFCDAITSVSIPMPPFDSLVVQIVAPIIGVVLAVLLGRYLNEGQEHKHMGSGQMPHHG